MPTTTIDLLLGKPLKHGHQASDIVGLGLIGSAEDGVYTDGLFTDFTAATPIGTAVDRFNEVLKALAPPPAPDLSSISIANTGVSGKLSFDATHTILGYTNVPTKSLNSTIGTSETITDGSTSVVMKGIFNATTTMTGTLASATTAHAYSYPANSLANGNLGTLRLYVNDTLVQSTDLTTFGSGASMTNGSGFTLSAATSVRFASGDSFDGFKYRTGTYTVAPAAQRPGYNKICVQHVVGGTTLTTNYFGWVVDDDTTATTYASGSLNSLSMTGLKTISGVKYNTGGTAIFSIIANNVHRKTYSSSASGVSFTTNSNGSMTNTSIDNVVVDYTDALSVSRTLTAASPLRILNNSNSAFTAAVTIDRTVQSDLSSSTYSAGSVLIDSIASSSTSTLENFDDEVFRVASNVNTLTTAGYDSVGGSPSDWDGSISLVSATSGYSNGLLIASGSLKYPTQGFNSGNYSTIANGPVGNVNYSAASGNRQYLRYFYTPSSSPRNNFKIAIVCSSTSFVSVATGPSASNVTLEICAPNVTTDGSNLGVWKDATVAYTSDVGIGCYASTFGSVIPTNWGMTLGGGTTANSGNAILIRVTAASGWTGSIDGITLTWM